MLRPSVAMDYCYQIYKKSTIEEDRIFAVELLRVVADKRVLRWVSEFLEDSNQRIQTYGIGIIDYLLMDNLVSYDDVKLLLEKSAKHQNVNVRETVNFILDNLIEE